MLRVEVKNTSLQNGWRTLILHPFFYNGIACLLLMLQSISFIFLNFAQPLTTVNIFNFVALFHAILGLYLAFKGKAKNYIMYSALVLLIILPTLNIIFNNGDLRLSIFELPVAYLFGLGAACHALNSKAHGLLNSLLLLSLLLPMTQPSIIIEANSIGIQIVLIAITIFTIIIFIILFSWHKTKSFLSITEKELIDKIGEVIDLFSNVLIKNDTIQSVLANVADKIIPSLEFEDCVIYLLDEKKQSLRQESAFGSKLESLSREIVNPLEIPMGHGIVGTVAQTGIAEIINDTSKDNRYIVDNQLRFSELCVPIIANNKVIGVIDSEHSTKNFFNEVHLYLMQIIAGQCASKITEIQHRSIHQQSVALEISSKKLQETNLIKSRFISNLSHDLKTPLTLILGPAKELTKRNLGENELVLIKSINQNGLLLKNTIDELLALNELNFLTQSSQLSSVNFESLMTNWVDNFVFRSVQKNVTVHQEITEKVTLKVDEKKLSTVVLNFLDYSLEMTQKGGTIRINYGWIGTYFYWEIENSGPLSFKGHSSIESIENELSIAQQLIASMGGQLTLSWSNLGGLHIQFKLPQASEFNTIHKKKDDKEKSLLISKEKPIVLIIEDHDELREFILESVKEEFICIGSATGEEGLEIAKKMIPDLIITDLMLPGMSGEQVCQKIRNHDQINHIPVIILSAKSMTVDRVELYRLGAENYLIKPFEIDELLAIIRNTIDQRRTLKNSFQLRFLNGEPTEMKDSFILSAIDILNKHLTDVNFNVATLAKELKVGRNQLQRKINMLTNMTPVEFIRTIRLKKAYKLLKETDLSISEIAYAVGFNNLSYFTRSFKRLFELLPSEVVDGSKSIENNG